MPKILVIVGATATGKTELAVSMAKKLNTEVISADSMLVYKGLDIGTAKPTIKEMQGVLHHMIDVVSPSEEFSVSDYERTALPIVESLLQKNKVPILCGGTGFYVDSILYKSGFGTSGANAEIRKKYEKMAETDGKEAVFMRLKEVDKESALKLHPNDLKRVIRALEIFETTGKKKSEQQDERTPRFDFIPIFLDYPREEIYERINRRVDTMVERGLFDEVDALLRSGVKETSQCMQGIGYKEIVFGEKAGQSVEEIKEEIKKNTRNYAKRQITFFKRLNTPYRMGKDELPIEKIVGELNNDGC